MRPLKSLKDVIADLADGGEMPVKLSPGWEFDHSDAEVFVKDAKTGRIGYKPPRFKDLDEAQADMPCVPSYLRGEFDGMVFKIDLDTPDGVEIIGWGDVDPASADPADVEKLRGMIIKMAHHTQLPELTPNDTIDRDADYERVVAKLESFGFEGFYLGADGGYYGWKEGMEKVPVDEGEDELELVDAATLADWLVDDDWEE